MGKRVGGAPEFFGVLPLVAVALFALNNGVLKRAFPGFVTGKLSDLPIVSSCPCSSRPCSSGSRGLDVGKRVATGIALTAAIFIAVKTSAAASGVLDRDIAFLLQPFGVRTAPNRVDVTDLCACRARPGLASRAALDPRAPAAAGRGAPVNQPTRRIVETLVLAATALLTLGHGIGGFTASALTRKGETRSYNVVGTCGPTGVVTVSWSPSTFCSVTLTGDDVGLPTSGNLANDPRTGFGLTGSINLDWDSECSAFPPLSADAGVPAVGGCPEPRLRATPLPRPTRRLAGPRALVPGRPVARDARLRHPRLPGRDLFQPGAHGLSHVWLLSRVRSQRTERRRPDPAAPRLPHRDLPPELSARARAVLAD